MHGSRADQIHGRGPGCFPGVVASATRAVCASAARVARAVCVLACVWACVWACVCVFGGLWACGLQGLFVLVPGVGLACTRSRAYRGGVPVGEGGARGRAG